MLWGSSLLLQWLKSLVIAHSIALGFVTTLAIALGFVTTMVKEPSHRSCGTNKEEFSKAVITQIQGDRAFLRDPWEYFAQVGRIAEILI